ncbi:MAG: sensor histidine kinase [Clostridiaceae bacterium]
MVREIIINFFKDKSSSIILIILNSLVIIGFYKLTVDKNAEVLYPITITLFLMICYLILEGAKYYRFNKDIQNLKKDKDHNIRYFTNEQREIAIVFNKLNCSYIEKENKIINTYKEKQHFIANAIHKFKNYISIIGLIIEKNKNKDKKLKEVLLEIEKENDNLFSALEQALGYIRIDDFSNDFQIENIDLNQELKKIINDNRQLFINNEVFPVFNKKEEVIVCTDKKWNRLIIDQFITNAVKYSNRGEKINFTIEKLDEKVIFKVRDNGIGIASYDIKRVFEPFFTGENGRKIRNSTGIGLYIAKEAAKKLGNEISIKSEVNKGTEVSLSYLSKL